MKRFLTIFPVTENVHLIKDVGMIPFILHKNFGYDSTIASYRNGEYGYLESEVKGLKQVFISEKFKNPIFDVLWFLLLNFRKYDIVQCYHFQRPSLWFLFFFKFLKKITFSKGFTFLKLDAVDAIKDLKLNAENKFLSKNVDLISVETKKLHDYLNTNNTIYRKVEYIANGFYCKGENNLINFDTKQNLIITVGRIGTFQKNNEILLLAFKKFALINNEWKLEIIGPIEDSFKLYIKEFFELNPILIDRISFTGSITDRRILEDKYNRAKIFILTSRFEGFPLVFLESIKSGCTIISTDIAPAYDITDNEKFGALFPIEDSDALAKVLERVIKDEDKLRSDCANIQEFAYKTYSWDIISIHINDLINY